MASQRRVETENEEEDDTADDEGAQPADMLDQVRVFCTHPRGQVLTGTLSTGPAINLTPPFLITITRTHVIPRFLASAGLMDLYRLNRLLLLRSSSMCRSTCKPGMSCSHGFSGRTCASGEYKWFQLSRLLACMVYEPVNVSQTFVTKLRCGIISPDLDAKVLESGAKRGREHVQG